MSLNLSFSNIFQVLSAIMPFLVTFYLIMSSVINSDMKGVVYLIGVVAAIFISGVFATMIDSRRSPYAPVFCNMFNIPGYGSQYSIPSLNSVVLGFTSAYLTIPMHYTDQTNPFLIGLLLLFILIDGITRVIWLCTTTAGVIFGVVLGYILGSAYFSLLHGAGADNLLYFSELVSNKTVCSRPKKQKFKCSVYKNGELVQNL